MRELQFLPMPPKPEAATPKISREEKAAIAFVIAAAVFVGALGLASSFQSVSRAATRWGFASPWMLPIAVDVAIPVFSVVYLLLIRFDMPLAWVRAVPWALTAVTVYLNWSAGHSLPARVGHGALPLLWVVLSEVAAHVYRVRIGKATGKRLERIRRSRWLLAPLTTAALWRRMVLWELTSYRDALDRERVRLLARAALRENRGPLWRWKAPRRERVLLRIGELTAEDVSAPASERPAPGADAHPSAPDAPAEGPAGALTAPAVKTPAERAHGRAHHGPTSHEADHVSARKKPLRSRKKSAEKSVNERREEAVLALYPELNKRPEWTDIRDALTAARLSAKPISRPTAQRIRERVEKDRPELAALGSDNVRPMKEASA